MNWSQGPKVGMNAAREGFLEKKRRDGPGEKLGEHVCSILLVRKFLLLSHLYPLGCNLF